MVKINIDGKDYEVEPKDNLLQTLLSLKIDVPYFCWHPAMGSVGSCRQCAVKKYADEKDTKGRIVMSCMEPVVDGMRISVDDPEVKQFRANLIELTMTDHPHDCPVCDEGGECHLQDVTLMSGHNYRRYEYNKRTHKNQ
ncbi:MAG TPA: 2Fe-2S iron-sulfur cluster binding domain-containing protein, partial [Caldithrix abyssi]|nr:2Fe-2S iron-sulfur cluster binding domain-containing protein [Caldithrix abyssi]